MTNPTKGQCNRKNGKTRVFEKPCTFKTQNIFYQNTKLDPSTSMNRNNYKCSKNTILKMRGPQIFIAYVCNQVIPHHRPFYTKTSTKCRIEYPCKFITVAHRHVLKFPWSHLQHHPETRNQKRSLRPWISIAQWNLIHSFI